MTLIENSVFDNRYDLLENIWEDEKREYWLSIDRILEREVVLFIMPKKSSDIDDNRKSMKTTARLQHPHIIPIYDLRETDEYLYAVQFYAENRSILEYMENPENNLLNIGTILQLAQQIASAIDFIHSHEIIHNHIRPDVILMDRGMNPYLTEFYVPRNTEKLIDKYGIVEYAAPEQFSSDEMNYRHDIYGYGITLYQLLVHQLPFQKRKDKPHLSSLGWKQQNEDSSIQLPSVHSLNSELPIGIDLVLKRLTSVDVNRRYQTASEAADDLNQVYYSENNAPIGKVFISYARKDKGYVHNLASELRRIGLDIWIDKDIQYSTKWDNSIEKALQSCDKMLLIVSPDSMLSENVQDEWSYFLEEGKAVFPFVYKEGEMSFRLRRRQYISSTNDLLNDVARIVDALGSNKIRG